MYFLIISCLICIHGSFYVSEELRNIVWPVWWSVITVILPWCLQVLVNSWTPLRFYWLMYSVFSLFRLVLHYTLCVDVSTAMGMMAHNHLSTCSFSFLHKPIFLLPVNYSNLDIATPTWGQLILQHESTPHAIEWGSLNYSEPKLLLYITNHTKSLALSSLLFNEPIENL